MGRKTLVTVLIPSYNHAPYISQSIRSVLEQDWSHIDLVVIDDGSSDSSPQIIRSLLEHRTDCQYIMRKNLGVIHTLNEGVAMARGEFLCFLASDDYLLQGSVRIRAEYLQAHPDCIAVFADYISVLADGTAHEPFPSEKTQRLFQSTDPIREFIEGANIPLHTLMVRTSVFREIGAFDPRFHFCEDLDVQVRLFLSGKVDYIDECVRCYRRHDTNISIAKRCHFTADQILCLQKYLYEMPELAPYRKIIRRRLTHKYRTLGKHLNSVSKGYPWEEDLFNRAWQFAWRDCRLLWRLMRWTVNRKVLRKGSRLKRHKLGE